MTGNFFTPSTSFDLYIVNDVTTWTNGSAIPSRLPETVTRVSSDADGIIPSTVVWNNPQEVGKYDIIVDVNGNGQYDIEIDAIDDNDIEATAGFNLVLVPSPSPTTSPNPTPTPTPSLEQSPSPSTTPTPSPTATPTQPPSPSPSPKVQDQKPFPTTLVIASIIVLAMGGVGSLFYFKKRKR